MCHTAKGATVKKEEGQVRKVKRLREKKRRERNKF